MELMGVGCVIAATIVTTACGLMLIPYTDRLGKDGWDIPIGLIVGEWFHRVSEPSDHCCSTIIVLLDGCDARAGHELRDSVSESLCADALLPRIRPQ